MAKTAPAPTLAPNAFIGRTTPPTDRDLAAALGPLKPLWDRVTDGLAGALGPADREWKSYGVKHGWTLILRRGARRIVYVAPCRGAVRVALILGDRAVEAARAARLGKTVDAWLEAAPRYPEGTGIRVDLKTAARVPALTRLARIKLEN